MTENLFTKVTLTSSKREETVEHSTLKQESNSEREHDSRAVLRTNGPHDSYYPTKSKGAVCPVQEAPQKGSRQHNKPQLLARPTSSMAHNYHPGCRSHGSSPASTGCLY